MQLRAFCSPAKVGSSEDVRRVHPIFDCRKENRVVLFYFQKELREKAVDGIRRILHQNRRQYIGDYPDSLIGILAEDLLDVDRE
jgi:hypothetical protein